MASDFNINLACKEILEGRQGLIWGSIHCRYKPGTMMQRLRGFVECMNFETESAREEKKRYLDQLWTHHHRYFCPILGMLEQLHFQGRLDVDLKSCQIFVPEMEKALSSPDQAMINELRRSILGLVDQLTHLEDWAVLKIDPDSNQEDIDRAWVKYVKSKMGSAPEFEA